MSKQATQVVLSSADTLVYGITRFEITARRVKAYGMDSLDPKPKYIAKRGNLKGTESVYHLYEHVKANLIETAA